MPDQHGDRHDVFDRRNIDRTVNQLIQAQPTSQPTTSETARKKLEDAEAKLRRFQNANASGVDPVALVESINEAPADRAVAQAELATARKPAALIEADVYAMVDSLGDTGAALAGSEPGRLAQLGRLAHYPYACRSGRGPNVSQGSRWH